MPAIIGFTWNGSSVDEKPLMELLTSPTLLELNLNNCGPYREMKCSVNTVLETLHIGEDQCYSDISWLSQLRALTELSIDTNCIHQAEHLPRLPKLRKLNMCYYVDAESSDDKQLLHLPNHVVHIPSSLPSDFRRNCVPRLLEYFPVLVEVSFREYQ